MNIKDFLQSEYRLDSYLEFLHEKFRDFEENNNEYTYLSNKKEQEDIEKYRFLGQVELDDNKEIGFFEFVTTENKDIENNKISLNNILKRIANDELLDGAIAVFFNPSNKNIWRLSFISFTYDENNKHHVNNLKRYTYVLGKDIPIKTAYFQLKKLNYPKFSEIEDAFSVESITEEFYKGIINLYNDLNNKYLDYPLKSTSHKIEFSIRLIGRLLFIKFLNKKKLIDDSIFNINNNYYKKTLEPLFFEQLNTNHNERNLNHQNNRIPFLNGGLFEPLYLDDYIESSLLKIDDIFFSEFFEHLNKFNFSIDENSIEDNDLAIDPEMLGRVFENLLAEINQDTRDSARKASGTYYTPREIVDFMINESLIEYLTHNTSFSSESIIKLVKNNELMENDYERTELLTALFKLKSIDPACGSGAFPIGLLQKIVKILELIDPDAEIWFNLQNKEFKDKHKNRNKNYIRKLSVIKNSIYGIDNHSIAIEITKLRAFLSLIVDEKVVDSKENRGIEPLPNLEFKFVCANTLLSSEDRLDVFKNNQEIRILKNKYFDASGVEKEIIRDEYINILEKNKVYEIFKDYNPFNPIYVADKINIDLMFDFQNKFDLVIGNPPYMRIQNIDKKISEIYKKKYISATGNYDLYVIFVERALDLISLNGIINYIMPDRWVNSAFGKGLRLKTHNKIYKLISFADYQVFNASTYTSLIFLRNDTKQLSYLQLNKDLRTNSELKKYLDGIKSSDYNEINYNTLDEKGWILTDKSSYIILDKLKKNTRKVKDIFERIYTGVQTSCDNIYFLKNYKYVSEGLISGYSEELKKEVIVEEKFTKPLLKGDDVIKYKNLSTNIVVLFPYEIILDSKKEKAILINEERISEEYPNAYIYLKECEPTLRAREKGKFNIDGEWYQYGRKQGMTGIEEPKLVARDISKGGDYSYDVDGKFYHTTTVYGYKKYSNIKEDYKFYLAILNSKLMWWYLQQVGTPLANGYYRYMPRYIEDFPIPTFSSKEAHILENLVGCIIYINSSEHKINSFVSNKHLSKEIFEIIDAMVFELYFRDIFKSKDISFFNKTELDILMLNHNDKCVEDDFINRFYNELNKANSPMRNNLTLIDIECKDVVIPIKRAYHV